MMHTFSIDPGKLEEITAVRLDPNGNHPSQSNSGEQGEKRTEGVEAVGFADNVALLAEGKDLDEAGEKLK
jgi:hypothetical protein